MNYGDQSELTESDKSDLKRLYEMVWRGELIDINGTPIRLVKPFHTIGEIIDNPIDLSQIRTLLPQWEVQNAVGAYARP